jgi:hypothetical protein
MRRPPRATTRRRDRSSWLRRVLIAQEDDGRSVAPSDARACALGARSLRDEGDRRTCRRDPGRDRSRPCGRRRRGMTDRPDVRRCPRHRSRRGLPATSP